MERTHNDTSDSLNTACTTSWKESKKWKNIQHRYTI